MRALKASPVTQEAFAPFGDLIAKPGARHFEINDGMATRHHDLARLSLDAQAGRPLINIFHGKPWALPLDVALMERHNLGSQAFFPLQNRPWLAVVAPAGDFDADAMVAFVMSGEQGLNYHPGTWHHPLVALEAETDFLVIDRGSDAVDCDIVQLGDDQKVRVSL